MARRRSSEKESRAPGQRPLRVGEIATVRIERADAYDLHGSVVGF